MKNKKILWICETGLLLAVLLVLFLIYLSNEHKIAALLRPIRK